MCQLAELLGDLGQQRLLEQADVLEQLLALRVRRLARRAATLESDRRRPRSGSPSTQHQDPDRRGDDLDHGLERVGHAGAVVVAGASARDRGRAAVVPTRECVDTGGAARHLRAAVVVRAAAVAAAAVAAGAAAANAAAAVRRRRLTAAGGLVCGRRRSRGRSTGGAAAGRGASPPPEGPQRLRRG